MVLAGRPFFEFMKPENRTIKIKRMTKVKKLIVYPGDVLTIDAKEAGYLIGLGKAEPAKAQFIPVLPQPHIETEEPAPKKRGRPSATLTAAKFLGGE